MAGGFDEKAGGAQMGVMQGPMVRKPFWDLLPLPCPSLTVCSGYAKKVKKDAPELWNEIEDLQNDSTCSQSPSLQFDRNENQKEHK